MLCNPLLAGPNKHPPLQCSLSMGLSLYPLLDPCQSRVSPVSFMTAPMPALMVADSIQKPRHTAISTAQLSLSLPTDAAVTPAWGAMLTTVSRG